MVNWSDFKGVVGAPRGPVNILEKMPLLAGSETMRLICPTGQVGLSAPRLRLRHSLICGGYFGLFQALMPLLGWLLGVRFQAMIASLDHWIAFILLGIIGVNMIRESRECGEESVDSSFAFRTMLPLAVATSIDALAVGVTFAFLQVDIVPAVLFIGCTTFVISAVGVKVGAVFGARFQHQAELLGGVVLVLMGIKILVEHLMGG